MNDVSQVMADYSQTQQEAILKAMDEAKQALSVVEQKQAQEATAPLIGASGSIAGLGAILDATGQY
jgi:exopolyphosphatase/pppGpp-phosphohydrolase